jgi:hypothetical protein
MLVLYDKVQAAALQGALLASCSADPDALLQMQRT